MSKYFKLFLALSAIALLTTATPALAGHHEEMAKDIPTAEIEAELSTNAIHVGVDGMVCDFCAQSIKKVFGKQDGVENVGVDLDNGMITINLAEGKSMDDALIEKLITDSGYTITKIHHTKPATVSAE